MTSSKNTKRALLASVLSVALCCAMLIGSTLAWFTDSVVNSGNVIQSGELKIQAFYYDLEPGGSGFQIEGINNGNSFGFVEEMKKKDLEIDGPVIEEDLWEPGISSAKMIEVKNIGNLAAKVKIYFSVFEDGLEKALWFDLIPLSEKLEPEKAFEKRPISELAGDANGQEYYKILPNTSKKFLLVYGMKEEAGNEFQNKQFTANIHLLATQVPHEEDGFGDITYDDRASVYVSTGEEFVAALERASEQEYLAILLKNDIDMAGITIPEALVMRNVVIDGYGHTISNMTGNNLYCYEGTDNGFRRITFENADVRYGIFGYGPNDTSAATTDKLWVNDVHLKDCITYGGSFFSHTGADAVVIKNSTVDAQSVVNPFASGLTSGGFIGNAQNYRIENCTMSGTVVGTLSQVGGFIGQGSWVADTAIIRNSEFNGTIRSYMEGASIYILAGSVTDKVENVRYQDAKVWSVDGEDSKLYKGINVSADDISAQQLETSISADDIQVDRNTNSITVTTNRDVASYQVSQSVYYNAYHANDEVRQGNVSTPIKPSVKISVADMAEGKLDDRYRVLQVTEERDTVNRTQCATTDSTYAGEFHYGTYYFDARRQADGEYKGQYNGLVIRNGAPMMIVQVIAYDANGAYSGIATIEYTAD